LVHSHNFVFPDRVNPGLKILPFWETLMPRREFPGPTPSRPGYPTIPINGFGLGFKIPNGGFANPEEAGSCQKGLPWICQRMVSWWSFGRGNRRILLPFGVLLISEEN